MDRNRQPRTQLSAARLAATRAAAHRAIVRLQQRHQPPPPPLRKRLARAARRAIRRLLQLAVLVVMVAFLVIAIGAALPLTRPVPMRAAAVTAIENVTVIDPRSGSARANQTIVLHGARIALVAPAGDVQIPDGALRVDGRGRYAIPGLWDMHAHTLALSPQLHFPLLVATGVTSIRDAGDGCAWTGDFDCEPDHAAWRAQREAGTLLAPRLVASVSYHVRTLAEDEHEPTWRLQAYARNTVAELKARGDELLGIRLDAAADPREFIALLDEARARQIPAVAQLPLRVDLLQAELEALDSIEHAASLLPQCTRPAASGDTRDIDTAVRLRHFDASRCAGVLARLARYRVAYVPAHAAARAAWQGNSKRANAASPYLLDVQSELWNARSVWSALRAEPHERTRQAAAQDVAFELTRRAVAAEVPVLAGSDALAAPVVHGFGLHDELDALVRAGLTPSQALRSATWWSAQHAGLGHRSGLIEAGRDADLLLLGADPRIDIRHTRRIDTVVMRGAVYRRDALDRLLTFSHEQAHSFAVNCRFLWNILTA